MAHFRGSIQGSRGEASRLGGKASGLTAMANGWDGGVTVSLYVDDQGNDCAQVQLTPGSGYAGYSVTIYQGKIDEATRQKLRARAAASTLFGG